ncbi:unnamed protein product [Cuscuta campestris]|uniref:Integrase zinc-binding domain-containing protein n=1 Tax=Cuscuta campestris TaxID=132261 RepID=A0A484MRG0_9ASTE|nr:unnamed protein product [Cuscuta campestris]
MYTHALDRLIDLLENVYGEIEHDDGVCTLYDQIDELIKNLQSFRSIGGMLGAIKVLIDSPPSVPNLVSTVIDRNAEAHDHASKKKPSIDSQVGDDVDIRHEAINKDNGRSNIVEKIKVLLQKMLLMLASQILLFRNCLPQLVWSLLSGFMPFAYPGMTPPIMPPPVSTPSTFVPRMVPIHLVNLTGTMNEAAPSNVHEINEAEQEAARRKKGKAIAEPSKTRDSAFKCLGDKEDRPRKSTKLRLGPEMGRTSAMERLGGSRHAQSRRSRESETIHQDEEEAESQPRASTYTRLSYDEDDLDKIGSVARKLRALEEKVEEKAGAKKHTLAKSPFSARVHAQRLRRKIKLDVEKFTGKEDPNVHLDTFHNVAQMAGCTDTEECLLFFSSLRGRPVEWFNDLPHGRIGSFEKLAEVFRKKYQNNCIKRKKFTYLNTVGRPPSSYQEAYNTAWEYADAEVLNKSKRELEEGYTKVKSDKPKKDDQMGGSKLKATYDGSVHQIREELGQELTRSGGFPGNTTKHARREPITFTDRDLPRTGGDHNDPLVITMDINGADVARVLVDTGSSVNVLYIDAFKKLNLDRSMLRPLQTPLSGFTRASIEAEGQITLPVTLGFYTPNGIGEERGDQKNARSCYLEAVRKMTHQFEQIELVSQQVDKGEEKARIEPDANTEEIQIDASNPERKVKIGVDLQEELRTEIVQVLTRIKSDSSLVVGHINGNMEAKGEKMQKYRGLAKALLKDLAEYVMEQIPRGENTDADLLSKLTQAAPEHVSKLARIEMLEKASIEGLSVSLIEEDGRPNLGMVEPDDIWIDDLVKYYMTGQFPEDEDRVRKVKLRAPRFQMLDRRLYKRAFGGPLLRCLIRAEAERVIAEVHEGVCAAHQMSRTLAQRIILLGYFWPTMNQDCEKYVERCKTCQVFYKFPGRPATYYHPVSNVIPFARLPIEAKIMSFREKVYEEKGNEEDHLAELNLLEEKRMVAEAKMMEYQQAAKAYHDNKVGPRYFQMGNEVLRRREASKPGEEGKLAKKWEGPYRVTTILRPGTYKLETMEGRELERCWNSHHLRKFYR